MGLHRRARTRTVPSDTASSTAIVSWICRGRPPVCGTPLRVCDPEHVVIVVHGLAEVASRATERDGSTIRIDVALTTVGTFRLNQADKRAWDAMDAAAEAVLAAIAGDWPVEFWNPDTNEWQPNSINRRMPFAFHETGTLWMGIAESDSVSDIWGRIHETDNVFVLGGATFPTRGSWNPYLTMVTLARRLAERVESNNAAVGPVAVGGDRV